MKIEFFKSAFDESGFIADSKPKIILAGRSNVGKSSIINRAANAKIARVSSSPGKTASVNYYNVGGGKWWIDLPGYGYAKVSKDEQARWGELMEEFFVFSQRDPNCRGLLIVDARHKPTGKDLQMRDCFINFGIEFAVLANKSDKLKKSEIEPNLNVIRETLGVADITLCSAVKGEFNCALL